MSFKCCLVGSGYFKQPAQIELNRGGTSIQNARCYLHRAGGCSDKMSREHAISQAAIKVLTERPLVSGFPWLKGAQREIGLNSLTSHVLCQPHNSELNPLDTASARFFEAMKVCGLIGLKQDKNYLISGHDIERWMLKALAGLAAGGSLALGDQQIDGIFDPEVDLARLLQDPLSWRRPMGLYMMQPAETVYQQVDQVTFNAYTRQGTNLIIGCRLLLRGMEFGLFLLRNAPLRGTGLQPIRYRPTLIRHNESERQHTIRLSWLGMRRHRHEVDIAVTEGPPA